MHLKHPDLILIVAIAIENIIWALLPNYLPIISFVLALPLVFLLPGYALTEALFHRRSLNDIYRHRFILSLGLSLTIDILSGFILNLFPMGLGAVSWALCLGVLTVAFSLLAAYRRGQSSTTGILLPRFHVGIHRYVLVGLCLIAAVAVTVLAIQFSAASEAQQPHPGFTQLWMLPSPQSGNNCAVRLGVQSFEATSVTYLVIMTANGAQVNTWPSVVLAPQEKWSHIVTIAPASTNSVYVEVVLYRSDNPGTVYREVHMTLSNAGKSKDKMQC